MEIRQARMTDLQGVRRCAEAAYAIYMPRIGKPPAPMVADFARLIGDGSVHVLSDGGTIAVPRGTYAGPLVIDRSLTVVADGAVTIDAGGRGDAVRVTAPDVTLRGFRICGTGDSLDQQNAGVAVSAARAWY